MHSLAFFTLTQNQSYLQYDLNQFYAGLAINVPQGYAPTLDSIDGGVVNVYDPANNGESNLDLQYAIALGNTPLSSSYLECLLLLSVASTRYCVPNWRSS